MVKKNEKSIEGSGETGLETGVSYVLITGVVISLLLEVAGLVLFYLTFHSLAISHGGAVLVRGRGFFDFLYRQIFGTSGQVPALRLMMLGIAILILTPYVRAVMSVVYFALTRNVKYVIITLFVLVILTISLVAH
jgi:uncharacterized membrane protein